MSRRDKTDTERAFQIALLWLPHSHGRSGKGDAQNLGLTAAGRWPARLQFRAPMPKEQ
jgi:hypothetical protein